MSAKLRVKNLNASNVERNATKEFSEISLSLIVNDLVQEIANGFQVNPSKLDLLYRGEIMDRNKILNDYLKNSHEAGIVLVENKQRNAESTETARPSEKDIQELSHRIGTTFKSRRKRKQLEHFTKSVDYVQNMRKLVPVLNQDQIAQSFIQSADLILQLSDFNKAKSLINTYPNIYHAVKQVFKLVSEDIKSNPLNTNTLSKGSYSIDDMSDDEEGAQMPSNRRTNSSGPPISQDHLSAVLAALNQQQQQQAQRSSNNSITRDYFQNVMQQVLNQSLSNAPPVPPPPPQQQQQQPSVAQAAAAQTNPNLSDEHLALCLERMHEFGFWDDDKNMRALFITEGNVEAAISLIVEGIDF